MNTESDLFKMFADISRPLPVSQDDLADALDGFPFEPLTPLEVDEHAMRMENIRVHAPDDTYRRALQIAQDNIDHR